MGIFHNSMEYLGTSNGLMLVGRSKMGDSKLGEHRSIMIVDTVSTILSLCGAKGFLIQVPSWASDNGVGGLELGLLILD